MHDHLRIVIATCGGLNKNCPPEFLHISSLGHPLSGIVWGGNGTFRKCSLDGGILTREECFDSAQPAPPFLFSFPVYCMPMSGALFVPCEHMRMWSSSFSLLSPCLPTMMDFIHSAGQL